MNRLMVDDLAKAAENRARVASGTGNCGYDAAMKSWIHTGVAFDWCSVAMEDILAAVHNQPSRYYGMGGWQREQVRRSGI